MSTNHSQGPKAAASDEKERFPIAADEGANVVARRVSEDASRTSDENERFDREREKERKRDFGPLGRRGGLSRSTDDGGASFWVVLIVVFSLIFLWNAIYQPPRREIPLGKLIELIEAGAPQTAQSADFAQSSQNAEVAQDAQNADVAQNSQNADVAQDAQNVDVAQSSQNADVAQTAESVDSSRIAETEKTEKAEKAVKSFLIGQRCIKER